MDEIPRFARHDDAGTARVSVRRARLLLRKQREKRGFFGGSVGDGFELRVVAAQRFGDFYFLAGEQIHQLQGVNDSFGLKMIVGDDESFVGGFGHVLDAFGPGFEFRRGVKIVVAFGRRGIGVVAEPSVVTAAVQANIADGRGDAFAGDDGTADDRLVDIAETDAALVQEIVEFFFGPGGVAHFDDQRVIVKLIEEDGETLHGFGRVVKRKWELQQHGAKALGVLQNVEAGADQGHVGGGGGVVVGKIAPEFCGEKEFRVSGDTLDPLFGVGRLHRMVEGGIDFDGVEKFGEESGFVKTLGARLGIKDAFPIGIGPAGGTDVNLLGVAGLICGFLAS